jgi:hypothetical protein
VAEAVAVELLVLVVPVQRLLVLVELQVHLRLLE